MDKYAVIGNPVQHSISPLVHTEFAKQTQQNMSYEKIEAPLDKFRETIEMFIQQGGKGANITLPFKLDAYALANQHSELADEAGAANTLQFRDNGDIYADSTDGIGLIRDLTHNHHYCLQQKKILLLGAGGAARLLIGPLLAHAPTQLTIANRTASKAIDLAARFQHKGSVKGVGFDALAAGPYDLIINATSAGYTGASYQLPNTIINQQSWCYDLMYGKQGTPFLEWAKQQQPAARCLNGLGMLVEQAAASFYLWRGVYPQTQPVIEQLSALKDLL